MQIRRTKIPFAKFDEVGMPEAFWKKRLSDYTVSEKTTLFIKKYLRNFKKFRAEGVGLFLSGENQSGKTLLACCVMKGVLVQGYTVAYGLIREITDQYFDFKRMNSEPLIEAETFPSRIIEPDVLVIDGISDPDVESNQGVAKTFLYVVRKRTLEKRVTIFCSDVQLMRGENEEEDSIESLYGYTLAKLIKHNNLTWECPAPKAEREKRLRKLRSLIE